jgi:N-acetylglucosaminyldiphosphoundecaprenol N-acetyl-beta-D-mannosaminyltransferase
VVWAAKFLGKHLDDRFSGVDFMEKLCEKLAKRIETVGFLGGMPGVAVKTADCLKKRYPDLNVVFVDSEWHNREYSRYILGKKKEIDVLFVAFGSPKQEKWIYDNLSYLPVKMAVGVGGAFDFISGRVPRAPLFVRKAGLEWLFRLAIQPWRIKRQLALLEFVFLVFKEKIKNWGLHRGRVRTINNGQ